jgi:hypothetical protein
MGVGVADGPRIWCTDSRSPSIRGGDENDLGSEPELGDFDAERSNSSVKESDALTPPEDIRVSFRRVKTRFEGCEGLRPVAGNWGAFPCSPPFLSLLSSCRECLLTNLSALGFGTRMEVCESFFSCTPACGGGPRENAGSATSSFPLFFDRGFKFLTRRVRDGSGKQLAVSLSS